MFGPRDLGVGENVLPLDLGAGCMGAFIIAASSELWTSAHVLNALC